MQNLVFGSFNLGAFRLRGWPVFFRFNWPACHAERPKYRESKYKNILLVKYHVGHARELRKRCERLIFDPLDCWSAKHIDAEPATFWRQQYKEIRFDDILAATPSAYASMREALPEKVKVHLALHPCDPMVHPGWYDPQGPVVYAGGLRFLGGQEKAIEEACASLGRKFVMRHDDGAVWAMRGASLAIALRLAPENTPLNRLAKPQIKLENAAAAGMPVLASDHPCVTSVRAEVVVAPDDTTDWAPWISRALASPGLTSPVRLEHYTDLIGKLVGEKV